MKKLLKSLFSLALAGALTLTALTGCSVAPNDNVTALAETGYLTLRVNPEIEVEYNKEGKVTDLTGQNEEGRAIVAAYNDYIGKDCTEVLSDLLVDINEGGYFVSEDEDHPKNVVLQVKPGSVIPDEDFLTRLSNEIKVTVSSFGAQDEGTILIDTEDYDDAYAKGEKLSSYITLDKAKEIALNHSGVDASKAAFFDREFDLDDGKAVYEIDFVAGGIEYEYEVDAKTGKILSFESDRDDHDDKTVTESKPTSTGYITKAAAKKAALDHVGVKEADAYFEKVELDEDDGLVLFEIEFTANGKEYEYDINAKTGKVVGSEQEVDDDRPVNTKPSTGTESSKPSTNTESSKPAVNNESSSTSADYISKDKAKSAALSHAGVKGADARFERVELDRDDGRVYYEVDFSANGYEYDYEIDAKSGKVLDVDKERVERDDDDDDDDDRAPANTANYIGKDKAKSTAFNHAGVTSAKSVSVELDEDDGRYVYQVEFEANGYEYDYEIDAVSGKVLKAEKDRND